MDETSMLYTEPSQEVGYSKPSVLVTGAAEVDPEVKVMYRSFNPTFILALMVIATATETCKLSSWNIKICVLLPFVQVSGLCSLLVAICTLALLNKL